MVLGTKDVIILVMQQNLQQRVIETTNSLDAYIMRLKKQT